MQHLNGQVEPFGQIQFVNETENIMTGQSEYNAGYKRSAGDADLDSDSEMDRNLGSPSMRNAAPGKKTRGRVKIEMKFIENKLRRYTTFSKRKTGIMKKAYELSTLTGTQVMLLVASETGHVYTFATRKLQPMITSESGKALIQTCLNSPDMASLGGMNPSQELSSADLAGSDEDDRMNPGGYEETALNYTVEDDQPKTMVPPGGLSISPSPSPVPLTDKTPFSDGSSSDNHATPPPASTVPHTIAFNSYLGPTPGLTVHGGSSKTNTMTMQVPAAAATAFMTQPPGVPLTIAPISSATVQRSQANTQAQPTAMSPAGMFSLQGVPLSPATSAQTPASSGAQTVTAQAVAAASMLTGASGGAQPMMYQTPQGLVYAAGGIPEGYVLNLPQTPTFTTTSEQQQAVASSPSGQLQQQQQPQYITIPVPVSLATGQMFQPFLAQAQQQVQQHLQQQQQQQVERK